MVAQRRLYAKFARSGRTLTLEDVARIEYRALREAGVDAKHARGFIEAAYKQLKDMGLEPQRIPWGK